MNFIQNAFQGFINWHKENWLYWLVLAVGMVAILLFEARDVGLQGSQWFWLVVITVDVAILCIWIITWGGDEDDVESIDS